MDQSNKRCTVEAAGSGDFCDLPSVVDAPFPICRHHALSLFEFMDDVVRGSLNDLRSLASTWAEAEIGPELWRHVQSGPAAAPYKRPATEAVVYYLRFNGAIKIGHSTNLERRLHEYPPGSVLLATEPGHTGIERQRHKQFRQDRLTPRGEWFAPSEALLEHIAALACVPRAAA